MIPELIIVCIGSIFFVCGVVAAMLFFIIVAAAGD